MPQIPIPFGRATKIKMDWNVILIFFFKTAPKCEKANLNAHVERRVASLETLECTFAKQSADTSYNRRIYKIELI
jgi:Zn ribbon nucleic-acid-binding protein